MAIKLREKEKKKLKINQDSEHKMFDLAIFPEKK